MVAIGLSEKGKWKNEFDKSPHVITVASRDDLKLLRNEKRDGIAVIDGEKLGWGSVRCARLLRRER